MFTQKTKPEMTGLDKVIHNLEQEIDTHEGHTKEYAAMTDQLTKLYAARENTTPDRISKDTMAIIAANLAGILIIVGYESKNVVTSKAMSFLLKLR